MYFSNIYYHISHLIQLGMYNDIIPCYLQLKLLKLYLLIIQF